MATFTTFFANTFNNQTGTTWTTTTVGNIDNGVSTPSGTFIVAGANSTSTITFDLAAMPSDFLNALTLNYNIRYKIDSLAGDTETLFIRIYKSNGTTALTNEMTVTTRTATVALTNSTAILFTGLDTAATKTEWDDAVVTIRTLHSATHGSDGSIWSIDELEFTGTYEPVPSNRRVFMIS